MRVINICANDYARYGLLNARALLTAGFDAEAFMMNPHVFGYPDQATLADADRILQEIENADVVQIMHSDRKMLEIWMKSKRPRLIVHHAGSRYRQNPDRYNALFNPFVETSIYCLTEFETLGSKNPVFLPMCIDTDAIKPELDFVHPEKIIVGHFPSKPEVKGTDAILRVMGRILEEFPGKFEFIYSLENESYEENYKRLQLCDVYIDLLASDQQGKPYGSFGTTSLEMAAMGKIVFTQLLNKGPYLQACPSAELYFEKNENELWTHLSLVLNMRRFLLMEKKIATRKWVEETHSLAAQGKRMLTIINNNQ